MRVFRSRWNTAVSTALDPFFRRGEDVKSSDSAIHKKCSSPTNDCFFSKKPTKREHTHVHTLNRKVYIQTGFIKKNKRNTNNIGKSNSHKNLMFVFNGTNESLAHPHLSQKACFCWMNSSTISVTSISWHRIPRWHRKKTHPCIVFRQRDSIFSWLNMYVYTNYVWNYRLIYLNMMIILCKMFNPKQDKGQKNNLTYRNVKLGLKLHLTGASWDTKKHPQQLHPKRETLRSFMVTRWFYAILTHSSLFLFVLVWEYNIPSSKLPLHYQYFERYRNLPSPKCIQVSLSPIACNHAM